MGGGKSAWMVNEAIQLSLDFPGNRGYLCRYENVTFKKTTLLTLQKFLPSRLILKHNKSEQFYELRNGDPKRGIRGSVIYYGGLKGSEGDGIDRIKSMELGWFGIDEATELPSDNFFLILLSRLRYRLPDGKTPMFKGLLASNPEPGWVKDRFINSDKDNHRFVSALPRENPYNPDDYEGMMRKNFPSDWVDKYLDGNWNVNLEGKYIFQYQWIRAAVDREVGAGEPCELGIDVAREGSDETAVACRWGYKVRIVYASHEPDTMKATGEIGLIIKRENPGIIRVDTVGIGGGMYDRLKELGFNVEEFKAGYKSSEPDKYFDLKAEVYWKFRLLLEDGLVDLPNDPVLIAQLSGQKYEIQSGMRVKIVEKEAMRKKGLKSPDRAEAVITAFFGKPVEEHGGLFSDETLEEVFED